jgi:hypothetical protein
MFEGCLSADERDWKIRNRKIRRVEAVVIKPIMANPFQRMCTI